MTPQEIRIGTRLELELMNRNGERVGRAYVSQLLEHQDDSIVVSAPIFESRLIYIPTEAQIRLTFMHREGLLGFFAQVTSREMRGNIAVLVVNPITGLEKTQRRTHYRLDCMIDTVLMLLDKDGNQTNTKALTKNISGSGLCLLTEVNIPIRTDVCMELTMPDGTSIPARGRVIRNTEIEIKKVIKYELGLHFIEIAKKDQDYIIRYIFQQQRLLLKKENQ